MRLKHALASLLVCALVIGLAPASAAEAKPCKLAKSKKVFSQGRVTVVRRGREPKSGSPLVYACSSRKGVFYRLQRRGTLFGSGVVSPFAVAGDHLAYQEVLYNETEYSDSSVAIRDLITGRVKERWGIQGGGPTGPSAARIVLARNLAIAWTESNGDTVPYVDRVRRVVVPKVGPNPGQILDEGPELDANSLTLAPDGRTIRWVNAGVEKSGVLP
jgi:hypothetical protein